MIIQGKKHYAQDFIQELVDELKEHVEWMRKKGEKRDLYLKSGTVTIILENDELEYIAYEEHFQSNLSGIDFIYFDDLLYTAEEVEHHEVIKRQEI